MRSVRAMLTLLTPTRRLELSSSCENHHSSHHCSDSMLTRFKVAKFHSHHFDHMSTPLQSLTPLSSRTSCRATSRYWSTLALGRLAAWCPIVEEIAKEFDGQSRSSLNTDENPNVASQYGIRSIPTLMVFKGGQKVDTVVGAVPKATLSGTISKYL